MNQIIAVKTNRLSKEFDGTIVGIRQMRELFQKLSSTGTTILISSHILSEVEQSIAVISIVMAVLLLTGLSLFLGLAKK